jgi:hypothetical protein
LSPHRGRRWEPGVSARARVARDAAGGRTPRCRW